MPSFAVLTSSDMGAAGQRADTSGDAIVRIMTDAGFELMDRRMLPDDQDALAEALIAWADSGNVDLVLTTGGTGLGPRDVMPQATRTVINFEVPGISEAIRSQTLSRTPMAMLSRGVAGVRRRMLIINLPGSPKGVQECLEVALPVLPHALDILRGTHEGLHRPADDPPEP